MLIVSQKDIGATVHVVKEKWKILEGNHWEDDSKILKQ